MAGAAEAVECISRRGVLDAAGDLDVRRSHDRRPVRQLTPISARTRGTTCVANAARLAVMSCGLSPGGTPHVTMSVIPYVRMNATSSVTQWFTSPTIHDCGIAVCGLPRPVCFDSAKKRL